MKNTKKNPADGMMLQHRERMYFQELGWWLMNNPLASPSEIDEAIRRYTKKWRV